MSKSQVSATRQDARTTMGSVRRLAETLNAFFAAPDPAPAGETPPGQPGAAESLQELLEYWRQNGVKIRLK